MAVDEVVDVTAMGHGLVATLVTVDVPGEVAGARVLGSALLGVCVAHAHGVLLDRAGIGHVVQMTVMHVVDVALVRDGGVTAVGTVEVWVFGVAHWVSFSLVRCCSAGEWELRQFVVEVVDMVKDGVDKRAYVAIGEGVVNVFAFAPSGYDATVSQGSESLGDRRLVGASGRHQLRNAGLTLRYQFDESQSGRIGDRLE